MWDRESTSTRGRASRQPRPRASRGPMAGKVIRTFEGRLGDFFIPGEERSHWLYRLTIIRDDLQFEMGHLKITAEEPDTTDMWHLFYFLRRISVSISDACRVLRHDLPAWVKKCKDALPPDFLKAVKGATQAAEKAVADLEVVRDKIGAHVEPEKADQVIPGAEVVADMPPPPMIDRLVKDHPEWRAKVTIGDEHAAGTCLHQLSVTSFFAIWPEVKDTDTMLAKHAEYKAAIIAALRHVVPMIDFLLWMHWSSNPAIKWSDSASDC